MVLRLGDQARACGFANFDPWDAQAGLTWDLRIDFTGEAIRLIATLGIAGKQSRAVCTLSGSNPRTSFVGMVVRGTSDDGSDQIGVENVTITGE